MEAEKQIIECVPNFSEGRDKHAIKAITDAIESVGHVSLLNVDPGEGANRTVVTFVGVAHAVVEAAFRAVRTAGEVIDMRVQHGTHPRIGATDVLPLVPVSGITLAECAELARQLARRIADELGIPCYCYEASAFKPERKNLAVCRAGEYEALAEKLSNPEKRPDFMPRIPSGASSPLTETIARSGCTVVGARDFLIAVNFNLDTTSVSTANDIACDVREKGRPQTDPATGDVMRHADGKPVMQPGTLKAVKAIGWYIEEYGIAQVSMNMTNLHVTPLHRAYEEVCRCARNRGVRVTGTEIIGLVPRRALIDAGSHFRRQQQLPDNVSEKELIDTAIQTMGLSDLQPFVPEKRVIEYLLGER